MLEVRTIEQFTKLQDIFIKQKNIWFFVVLFCVLVILVGMIFYSCLQKHQKIQRSASGCLRIHSCGVRRLISPAHGSSAGTLHCKYPAPLPGYVRSADT